MKKYTLLYVTFFVLVLLLAACSDSTITARDVRAVLEKEGLEVTQITVGTPAPIDVNGDNPSVFKIGLPTASMENPEYVFVQTFDSTEAREQFDKSDGNSLPKFEGSFPHMRQKKNVIVIYWSHDKQKPLLMKQFSNAMDKLSCRFWNCSIY
ncbi:hypothetical protein SD71_14080 [Cohnella kolymensis]|uniref:Lipoprotein n=1 Tax=Cohnella kolymensis TaxID=1590652 RepID=A0ABR5A3Y8_9BACL|nr:hypothetical protein [Cohnella kolymensis]KIL35423.1 hypothetical protein SD71_14080 [Cohnella kolymensis]